MSERKRPEAEEAMLRLLVDDAEEYERMVDEGHRELCIEYQPLIPALVEAAVLGRELTGELKEARDYLKECDLCAESLESSSKALRDLAAEDGQEEDEPFEPPKKELPTPPKKEPGKIEAWWIRFTKTRGGLIALVGGMFCVVALVGLFLQSGRQCAREEARRDTQDASLGPQRVRDAGAIPASPDAALDPRSWLRKKGPLKFMFITLHLAGQRMQSSLKTLRAANQELKVLATGPMGRPTATLKRLRATLDAETAAVARLAGPLDRAATFIAKVKDDGTTPDFAAQLAAAKLQLSLRRKDQDQLKRVIAIVKLNLDRWK